MTSKTMRAVDIKNGAGPASALFINDATPLPTRGPSQALVRIRAFGLNRMDLLQRLGYYPVPAGASKVLGVEFSGEIAELGEKAEGGFAVGDAVFGLAYGGAYAEYIAVDTAMLLHKPEGMSYEEAAGIPETWITALQALFLVGGFAEGKSVLWHAGASGVSIAGQQLARAGGASAVYATTRQAEKAAFCRDVLKADGAVDTSATPAWDDEILGMTGGRGVDIVIDYVGAPYFQQNLNVLAMDGVCVTLGALGGTKLPDGVDISGFVRRRITVRGSTLRSRSVEYQRTLRDMLAERLPGFGSTFKMHVDRVMPWTEIVAAHEAMERNETKGKIICTVD
ncbi:GroES-like protein [Trichodelitschia bisporula]|uniref:GroES-like protein n=1 Tax=Trichodelitschia bisporula TaxID=703511 RepID=A0A6G1I1G3_9PEZI|nr:GroES-like protein [Trichodelitschia bisporula]